jgi:plastocyanin
VKISTRAAAVAAVGILGSSALTACTSSHQATAADSDRASARTSARAAAASPSPSGSGSPSVSASAAAAVITIEDFGYGGAASVPAGAMVTVRNDDAEAHTVTSDAAGAFDVTIGPGKSATFTAPAKAGSFPYHCIYHGNMHGTLKVG